MIALISLLSLLPAVANGIIVETVSAGVIGATTYAAQRMSTVEVPRAEGGCIWHGTAPFCDGTCPDDWTKVRETWPGEIPEDTHFGKNCLFGGKAFCCKALKRDSTWTGNWKSASTGRIYTCGYKPAIFDHEIDYFGFFCGKLDCKDPAENINTVFEIGNEGCDQLFPSDETQGIIGNATNGVINWYEDGSITYYDTWYKMP